MISSQEAIDRYKKIERRSDALGRVIGVKRLKLSQQLRIEEFAPTDGKTYLPMLAAAVVEIDDQKIPFPKNRAELDAIMDRLDSEGITAAAEAWRALMGFDDATSEEEVEAETEISAAKKLQGTPG